MAADDTKEQVLLKSIQTLSETKLLTENRVKLLHTLSAEKEVSPADFRRLEASYGQARARVNASLDRLLVELEFLKRDATQVSIDDLAKRAGDEMSAFIEASDTVIFGEGRSGTGAAALGAAPGFIAAIIDVWKTLRGEKRTRQDALIKRIEAMKWIPFNAVQ